MFQSQAELHDKQKSNIEKGSRCKHEINQINTRQVLLILTPETQSNRLHSLQQLDSHAHQKLEALRRYDSDCAEVVEWLRNNRNRFRMEIFEPAVLCVTVPNRSFIDAVEACFSGPQLRTIVAQCEEDYQLLNRLCVDTPEAIGKRARINTWYKPVDESRLPPQPLPPDQLRALGFDGYAIDFIDCPEGLKWFLCSDARLHRTVSSTLHLLHVRMIDRPVGRQSHLNRNLSTPTRPWRWLPGQAAQATSLDVL